MKEIPITPDLRLKSPASEETILDLERRLGRQLPNEYKLFLRQSNGFSLGGGVLMYSTSQIEERNATWQVPVYLPNYLAIGDTGGGEVIYVEYNDDTARLLITGSGAPFPDMMRELSPSLETWLQNGCEIPED